MRHIIQPFLASFVLACSSGPHSPSPAPHPPIVVAAIASSPVVASAEPPPPEPAPRAPAPPATPLPPAVELTLPIACDYHAERFTGAQGVTELSLIPGGKPFTRITDGAARVIIPTGLASDTFIEIQDGGLIVRGHAASSAIVLRPAVPFVLNDFAVPTNSASLSYTEAAEGTVTVIHPQPDELNFFGAKLKGTRTCRELGLEMQAFDPVKAIPGMDPQGQYTNRLIESGHHVDLRVKPNGQPVARLKLKEPTLVRVSEQVGGLSRISVPVDTLILFGWVKSSDLKTAGDMAGYGTGRGRMGIRDPELPTLERIRCDTAIPLIAEAFGERRWVGSILPNTVIDVISRTDAETRVWVKTRGIHSAPNAEFHVRTSDLSQCVAVVLP